MVQVTIPCGERDLTALNIRTHHSNMMGHSKEWYETTFNIPWKGLEGLRLWYVHPQLPYKQGHMYAVPGCCSVTGGRQARGAAQFSRNLLTTT
jgi:hypothetical protein